VHVHSASFGRLLTITDVKNYNYKIDISANKVLDLYNSHLLRTYALLDERFHIMALLIKSWNKKRFPSKIERLNSYSIVLMIIAFLQYEEVLPRLQQMASEEKVIKYVKYHQHKESSQVFHQRVYETNVAFESDVEVIAKKFKNKHLDN